MSAMTGRFITRTTMFAALVALAGALSGSACRQGSLESSGHSASPDRATTDSEGSYSARSTDHGSHGPLFVRSAAPSIVVGTKPSDIAAQDVNGDGTIDIVTVSQGPGSVTVLLGEGGGKFRDAPASPLPEGALPHLLALGDADGNGTTDMAVTSHDSHEIHVFLGDGRGRFAPSPRSPFAALNAGQPHNHGLALRDVDGDGTPDLTTANQNDNSVSVLLGDGRGSFAPAPGSPFRVGRSPYPHALGDLDADGRIDIVTPNVQDSSVTVLLGQQDGGFREGPGSPFAVAGRPFHVALGDVNGDSRLDAVVSHDDLTILSVLLGDEHGKFRAAPGSPLDIGRRGWKIVLADFDRDSRLDLATGAADGTVPVWLGDGSGGFSAAPGSPYRTGPDHWSLAVADVDGDGKLDIVSPQATGSTVTLLIGR